MCTYTQNVANYELYLVMKKKLFFIAIMLLCGICIESYATISIIPKPAIIREGKESFIFDKKLKVWCQDAQLDSITSTWIGLYQKAYSPGVYELPSGFERVVSSTELPKIIISKKQKKSDIILMIDKTLEAEEYNLKISKENIIIKGGTDSGVWWGLQTLSQILIQKINSQPGINCYHLPELIIEDRPAFSYRGAMLDCCRHFFNIDEVKKYIDILAIHKINVLHWHLTDDQGWRIEIKKYPLLTAIGSIRKETMIGHYRQKLGGDGKTYGGYYTQEQIKDIIRYASERKITIIPEIEMPGHSQAALASYPNLGCTDKKYEVRTVWGISNDVVCLGKEETYNFFMDILDEVSSLFPSQYIHIGGDEARSENWKTCPLCQKKMKELGYSSEKQLQGYLVSVMENHLKEKGKKIIGWDEIVTAGISKNAVVMCWRGPEWGIKAANMGNNVVMVPRTHFYFDYYQTNNPELNKEPLAIGGNLNIEKSYSFNPFDNIKEGEKKNIIGIQASLWTEYIDSFDKLQHFLLPRIASLSENAWSKSKDSYKNFIKRVRYGIIPVYQYMGYNYAPYAFKVPNFEENEIPDYKLPELLKTEKGNNITTSSEWIRKRRPEIMNFFTNQVYGTIPEKDVKMTYKCLEESKVAIKGKASRKQIELTFSRNGISKKVLLLVLIPNNITKPVPCFLGFNFKGNNTISFDKDVIPSQYSEFPIGNGALRWDIESIIDSGYALVTAHYYDFFYDKENGDFEGKYPLSIMSLFGKNSSSDFLSNEGKAISAWAWGYSRIIDYISINESSIDNKKIAILGHSRLGKAALWAGANDNRIALVISNNSGCCGSAISKRRIGEDYRRIMRFKHWFCTNFYRYIDNEESMPYDQHELIALIAPRPVYIASAIGDIFSDPKGEFLSSYCASPAWKLFGLDGIKNDKFPEINTPINDGYVGYHVREGKHGVTYLDWKFYIEFANKFLK